MAQTINPAAILKLHKDSIVRWKSAGIALEQQGFYLLVEENHAFNYQLWHAEDKARREDMGFEFVYQAKRAIDGFNQQRNNKMEAMDEFLFQLLQPAKPDECPVNSESPGMIIDRLSILALKSFHMDLQTQRSDTDEEHKALCTKKLITINQQLSQLSQCLGQLLAELQAKTRTFRVYHQFKMYNDPKLNPELY
ncbi:MAG: DUF4254 domain-containing protein [Legionella sp.]|jgi:hypothetical protein